MRRLNLLGPPNHSFRDSCNSFRPGLWQELLQQNYLQDVC
jgi:hypothetical protein